MLERLFATIAVITVTIVASRPLSAAQLEPIDHQCYCVGEPPYAPCDEAAIHQAEPPNGCTNFAPAVGQAAVPFYCLEDAPGPAWVEMSCSLSGCLINGIMNGPEGSGPCGVTIVCNQIPGGYYPVVSLSLGFAGNPGGVVCDYPINRYDKGADCTANGMMYWNRYGAIPGAPQQAPPVLTPDSPY